jgi:hypothetical protein
MAYMFFCCVACLRARWVEGMAAKIFGYRGEGAGYSAAIFVWFLRCSLGDNSKCLKDSSLKSHGYLGEREKVLTFS